MIVVACPYEVKGPRATTSWFEAAQLAACPPERAAKGKAALAAAKAPAPPKPPKAVPVKAPTSPSGADAAFMNFRGGPSAPVPGGTAVAPRAQPKTKEEKAAQRAAAERRRVASTAGASLQQWPARELGGLSGSRSRVGGGPRGGGAVVAMAHVASSSSLEARVDRLAGARSWGRSSSRTFNLGLLRHRGLSRQRVADAAFEVCATASPGAVGEVWLSTRSKRSAWLAQPHHDRAIRRRVEEPARQGAIGRRPCGTLWSGGARAARRC